MCLALVAASLVQLVGARVARADRIDSWVTDLKGGEKKVRLAAAVSLSNVDDRRAIKALIKALDDGEESIAGVAADGLGRQVTAKTAKSLRTEAIKALTRASKSSKSKLVKKQAQGALSAIQSALSTPSGGIYVNIGTMGDKTGNADKAKAIMQRAVDGAFAQQASSMTTTWPSGKAPTAKQLAASGTQGYAVGGSVVKLDAQAKGSATMVSCKISMYVATFPKQSIFAFADGGARVEATSSASDIEAAKEDCVSAAAEDLVTKKIIPTILNRP